LRRLHHQLCQRGYWGYTIGLDIVGAGRHEPHGVSLSIRASPGVRRLDVGRDREVHDYRLIARAPHVMWLICQRNAQPPRPQFPLMAVNLEEAPALQDQEYLVAQIVAVPGGDLPGLQAEKPGANLWDHEQVADVLAVIEHVEAHAGHLQATNQLPLRAASS